MNAKSQEEKPLRADSFRMQGPECRTNAAAQGRFVSRGVIATVVALIVVLIILVIVLGSLLGKERCSLQEGHKGKWRDFFKLIILTFRDTDRHYRVLMRILLLTLVTKN